MKMHSIQSNVGGWATFSLNNYLNTRLYQAFPDNWKQLIKQVQVKSNTGNMTTTEISSSDCYVFVPSIYEMVSTITENPYTSEGTPISHFVSPASRICYNTNGEAVSYWTRSPSNSWSTYVYRIDNTGAAQAVTTMNATNIYTRIMISI